MKPYTMIVAFNIPPRSSLDTDELLKAVKGHKSKIVEISFPNKKKAYN